MRKSVVKEQFFVFQDTLVVQYERETAQNVFDSEQERNDAVWTKMVSLEGVAGPHLSLIDCRV